MTSARENLIRVAALALVLAMCAVGVPRLIASIAENDRRSWAHAARRCALVLSAARTSGDSLEVLRGDGWAIGCASALTADTMPERAR